MARITVFSVVGALLVVVLPLMVLHIAPIALAEIDIGSLIYGRDSEQAAVSLNFAVTLVGASLTFAMSAVLGSAFEDKDPEMLRYARHVSPGFLLTASLLSLVLFLHAISAREVIITTISAKWERAALLCWILMFTVPAIGLMFSITSVTLKLRDVPPLPKGHVDRDFSLATLLSKRAGFALLSFVAKIVISITGVFLLIGSLELAMMFTAMAVHQEPISISVAEMFGAYEYVAGLTCLACLVVAGIALTTLYIHSYIFGSNSELLAKASAILCSSTLGFVVLFISHYHYGASDTRADQLWADSGSVFYLCALALLAQVVRAAIFLVPRYVVDRPWMRGTETPNLRKTD